MMGKIIAEQSSSPGPAICQSASVVLVRKSDEMHPERCKTKDGASGRRASFGGSHLGILFCFVVVGLWRFWRKSLSDGNESFETIIVHLISRAPLPRGKAEGEISEKWKVGIARSFLRASRPLMAVSGEPRVKRRLAERSWKSFVMPSFVATL